MVRQNRHAVTENVLIPNRQPKRLAVWLVLGPSITISPSPPETRVSRPPSCRCLMSRCRRVLTNNCDAKRFTCHRQGRRMDAGQYYWVINEYSSGSNAVEALRQKRSSDHRGTTCERRLRVAGRARQSLVAVADTAIRICIGSSSQSCVFREVSGKTRA